MKYLVFIAPDKIGAEPFTTSDVIARFAKISYRSVQKTIEAHECRLKTLGVLRFEIALPQKGSKGGRPKKIYRLNEPQATLLITFLKNTDTVADFKTELVRQFYAMRAELQRRALCREQLKPIRRELTDVVKEKRRPPVGVQKLYRSGVQIRPRKKRRSTAQGARSQKECNGHRLHEC